MSVSYRTTGGPRLSVKEKLQVLETKQTEEGISIIKYNLSNLITREVKLALHFTSKWIILSEIKFHSKPAEAEQMNHLTADEEPKINVFQSEDNLVRDSKVVEESLNSSENEDPEKEEPNSVVPITGGGSSQMYVGITIGILSMSVLLLLFTIFFILRKNKHRIFSKHSSKCFCFSLSSKSTNLHHKSFISLIIFFSKVYNGRYLLLP